MTTTPPQPPAEESSESTPSTPSSAQRPRTPRERTPQQKARFEADMAATRSAEHTRLALAIAKRVDGDTVICPECAKVATRGKFKIHADGGWKHFSSDGCHGDAVKILQLAGIGTGDAVAVLLGREPRTPIEVPDNAAELAAAFVGVRSKIDIEVFNGVLSYGRNTGGVEAAQEFYGTWHIDPQVVTASGAVMITDPKQFSQDILDRYGEERLIACGLFVPTERGPYCLISERFPVVEPHRHPATGDVLYMQFRGSHAQYQRYLDHKAGKRDYKGSEKIISLRGAPTAAQIGTGLHLIDKLPPGSKVHIVEGFKDSLAGQTLGLNTYGLPGVGVLPPEKICTLLARHDVAVALDADEAGLKAMYGTFEEGPDGTRTQTSEGMLDYLHHHGVSSATPENMFPGLDVTDLLVARHASGRQTGTPCTCPTCTRFRTEHPQHFQAPPAQP